VTAVSSHPRQASQPSISRKARAYLKANPQVALALPAPEETWFFRELDSLTHRDIHTLSNCNVVERDSIEFRDHQGNSKIIRWRVVPAAYDFIERRVSAPSLTPCGHRGVRCLDAGERYTCTDDSCEATFGRETAREVLEG
jgi:hypothetical protein